MMTSLFRHGCTLPDLTPLINGPHIFLLNSIKKFGLYDWVLIIGGIVGYTGLCMIQAIANRLNFLSEPHISYFRRSNLVFKALGQLWAISPWSLEIMHFVLLSLVHFSKVNMWIMALYCLLFKKTLNFSFLFCLTCNFLSLLSSLYFLFYPVIVLVHRSYFFDFIFQQKKKK